MFTVDAQGREIVEPASPALQPERPPDGPATVQLPLHPAQVAALIARDAMVPAALHQILAEDAVTPDGARLYLLDFYRRSGNPTDPVECLMLEQLLLAHHRLAELHVLASRATQADHLKVYSTAATRLMGEFRRLALAIRQYRTPSSPRSFNVVHQQNVVAAGEQQVTYVDQSTPGQPKHALAARSELEGNRLQEVQRGAAAGRN